MKLEISRLVGRALVVAGALLAYTGSASAVTAVGGGALRAFDGVQVVGLPDFACASSVAFADMPGMRSQFVQPVAGRAVVQFQGQFGGFWATPGARTVLRFVVDNVTVGSAIAVANDHGALSETFGFNAFTVPLAPGVHEAKVLWHVFGPAGATTCVEERSLIVLHP